MRFVIDANLSPALAAGLRASGHEAIHLRDLGMQTASDAQVLNLAKDEDRVLVSADTDFGMELARSRQRKPSVILFRRPTGRPAQQHLDDLLSLVPELGEALEAGSLIVIEAERMRWRPLPI